MVVAVSLNIGDEVHPTRYGSKIEAQILDPESVVELPLGDLSE